MKELFVDPVADEALPEVLAFVEKELGGRDIPLKTLHHIHIAVEEVFINITRHAYSSMKGDALIRCTVGDNPAQVTIQFLDGGIPFNPLEQDIPDVALPPEQREIGGLGIFMVQKIMSHVDYEYRNGKNILTIRKELS